MGKGKTLISGLHHYALRVPDLAVADNFFQDFGLETTEAQGQLVARCPGRGQDQVRLIDNGGAVKQLAYVSFTVQPGSLDRLRDQLERDRSPETDPPDGAPHDGLWTRDPDGTAVQLLDGEPAKARPIAEVLTNQGASRQRIGQAQWQVATEDVMPRRLGHTLLFTPQPARMTEFYTDVLGLRVSDRIHGGMVTFLNAGPGDHHVFGFINSSHPGFHHSSFEVPSIDAIALGAQRMRSQGREPGWGPGRHTIGSNFFHYNPRPVGQLDRVVLGHRPDRRLLGGRRLRRTPAPVGRPAARNFPCEPRTTAPGVTSWWATEGAPDATAGRRRARRRT